MCIYSGWIIPSLDFNIASYLALVGTTTAGTIIFSADIYRGEKDNVSYEENDG